MNAPDAETYLKPTGSGLKFEWETGTGNGSGNGNGNGSGNGNGNGNGDGKRELIIRTEDEEVLHHINIIDFILFV